MSNSMDMKLSKLGDSGGQRWHATAHGVANSDKTEEFNNNNLISKMR